MLLIFFINLVELKKVDQHESFLWNGGRRITKVSMHRTPLLSICLSMRSVEGEKNQWAIIWESFFPLSINTETWASG